MVLLDNVIVDLPRVPLSPEVVRCTQSRSRRPSIAPTIHVVLEGSLFPTKLSPEHCHPIQKMLHILRGLHDLISKIYARKLLHCPLSTNPLVKYLDELSMLQAAIGTFFYIGFGHGG